LSATPLLILIALVAAVVGVGWLLPGWFDDHFTPATKDPASQDRD
jgi:hypothetical protein